MVLVVAATAGATSACGDRDDAIDTVRAAVRATEALPGRFVYAVDTATEQTTVRGLVEDDFRFKARVSFNGNDGFDEVVSDDILAVRFIDTNRLDDYIAKDRLGSADVSTELQGVTALDALRSRRWVVDASGAPAVTGSDDREERAAPDPVVEALGALAYVDRALGEALEIERFDPDDLSPVYPQSEDVFPRPENGSGVDRYDLRRPFLPSPSQQISGGDSRGPTAQHFRKMAVYVKDGRVIQVREAIEARGKQAEDLVGYLRTLMREARAPARFSQRLDELVRTTPRDRLGLELMQFLNSMLETFGQDPIPIRVMTLDLTDVGDDVKVDLPQTDVVRGRLAVLAMSDAGNTEAQDPTDTGAAPPGGSPAAGEAPAPPDTGGGQPSPPAVPAPSP